MGVNASIILERHTFRLQMMQDGSTCILDILITGSGSHIYAVHEQCPPVS